MINISPSALKAFLACQRRWYLEFVARAPRVVPSYVTAGTDLDLAVQRYLRGEGTPGADGPDHTWAELECLRNELPAPGTVLVQHRTPSVPCPGLENQARITTGGLDYMTPPNAALVVIGDLKRIWHQDAALVSDDEHAALAPECKAECGRLSDDVQSQLYAWLVWQAYAPAEVIWRWTYCVRGTTDKAGKVTRKPKAFSVDVKADRTRVDAWFERVVLPAAQAMLEITGPVEAIEHDPESCESGARCFVRTSCPMFKGPVKGQKEYHVDLSRFAIKKDTAAAVVADTAAESERVFEAARIAINPPALVPVQDLSRETDTAATVLDVQVVEGPGAALLEGLPDLKDVPETIPAPAPDATEPKPTRRRRARTVELVQAPDAPDLLTAMAAQIAELSERNERQAQMLEERPMPDDMTTEQLRDALIDRGWRVYLEVRA